MIDGPFAYGSKVTQITLTANSVVTKDASFEISNQTVEEMCL